MDRSSVVLTAVLQALETAELRVQELESQLATNTNNRVSGQAGLSGSV